MKRALLATLIICSVVTLIHYQVTEAQVIEPTKPAASTTQFSALMRMKLEKANGILEGLSVENYDQIATNANEMKLLSLESGWNSIQTKEYAEQSRDFRRACDSIASAAQQNDLGRAALGYVSLTVRCVDCHTYMRNQAKRSAPKPKD